MKSCKVYKTRNAYKIITESKTVDWFFIVTEPIFVLPLTCTMDELKTSIFVSLNKSKTDVPTPDRDDWPKRQKYLLNMMQEKSFDLLHKNSKSCSIRLEDNVLTIVPYKLDTINKPSGGLVFDNDKKVEFLYNERIEEKIILAIIDILNG